MKDIIVITGPTGVGKTKLSIELAKRINAEIINFLLHLSSFRKIKVIIVGSFDKMNSDEDARIEGVSEDSIVISDNADDKTALLIVGHMQTDEQRESFRQFSEGDMVVAKGTITDINESAFFMDIDDIQ